MYLKWFLLAMANLLLKYFIAWPLTPVIVLFCDEAGFLPGWLAWFATPDNPCDGDPGWIKISRPFIIQNSRWKRYLNRCFWLWRNSLYGFNRRFLGIYFWPDDYMFDDGGVKITNGPGGRSGCSFTKLYRGNDAIAFQLYYVRQLHCWPHKCIRILLGYKLFQYKQFRNGCVSLALSAGIAKFTP